MKGSIIVHGGAGSGKYRRGDVRFSELKAAVEDGLSAMRRGSSLDGVEAAVRRMEDSGAFNAGRGACLTTEAKVELDAAVMYAKGRVGAGVGSVDCTYHPVSVARWVAENTNHVLMVGRNVRTYARRAGQEVALAEPSREAREKFVAMTSESNGRKRLELWRKFEEGNTVGAVAIDSAGVPAAAVSTGGVWLKLPGRVGDSAVLGAGIFADMKSGAACATGIGEEVIKNSLCSKACGLMTRGSAQRAADYAVRLMTKTSGDGTVGIVTVDLKGRVGASLNTEAMGRAWYDGERKKVLVQV